MSRLFLLCLLLALSCSSSGAFVAHRQHFFPARPSSSHRTGGPSMPVPPRMVTEHLKDEPSSSSHANWRQLPSRSTTGLPEHVEMAGTELHVGRVAMLGFVGLLVGEVVTGESFSQQFLEAFWLLIGVKH